MRLNLGHWLFAGTLAVAIHALVIFGWQAEMPSAAATNPGPQIEMADSLAGIMGEPLEVSQEAPEEIKQAEVELEQLKAVEPEVIEAQKPIEMAASAPVILPSEVTAAEALPLMPTMELKTVEPPTVLKEVAPKKVKAKEEKKKVEKPRKKTKKAVKKKTQKKRTKAKKTGKKTKARTTRKRGTSKKGGAGKSKRRASGAAIGAYKGKVRGRIVSAARRAKKAKGSVVVTVSISSSGGLSSVRVSGSSALKASVASAVRGTSFPRPPPGAPRSFSVRVTFR